MSPRLAVLTILIGASLTGCDEVVLYDVAPSGQLLVAADANGACALAGGARPRHLFHVDPATGKAKRLTRAAVELSWPTACGEGALYIAGRRKLMHVDAQGATRTLHTAPKGLRLLQPLAAPSLGHVAVLEATKLGVPGSLALIDRETGAVVHRVERALIGAVWTRAGLIVGRARGPRRSRYASGAGEIVNIDRRFRERVLFRGTLPALTAMSAVGRGQVVAALHTSGAKGPLALARLDTHGRGAKRGDRGSFDFWPAADAAGKRLLFTRSPTDRRSLQGELRLANAARPESSRVVPTPAKVAAPRWVGSKRIAFLTSNDHLVVQDLDGARRIDLTATLRAAYGATSN